VDIYVKNLTGLVVRLELNGPAGSYYYPLNIGQTAVKVCPGTYSYTIYGCQGGLLRGTISSGDTVGFYCK
jgi:hypothetical protein